MNNLLLKLFRIIPRKADDFKIIMGGSPQSGKSSILFQLKFKAIPTPVPTLAFNKEIFKHRSRYIHLWDLSSHPKRKFFIWDNLSVGAKGLIFVADSSEPESIPTAKEELNRILQLETVKGIPLLVYANKIDKIEIEPADLAKDLGLFKIKDREWFLQPSSTEDRSGLFEGLDWLITEIRKSQAKIPENSQTE